MEKVKFEEKYKDMKRINIVTSEVGYEHVEDEKGLFYFDGDKIYPSEKILDSENKEVYAQYFDFDIDEIINSDDIDVEGAQIKNDVIEKGKIKGLTVEKEVEIDAKAFETNVIDLLNSKDPSSIETELNEVIKQIKENEKLNEQAKDILTNIYNGLDDGLKDAYLKAVDKQNALDIYAKDIDENAKAKEEVQEEVVEQNGPSVAGTTAGASAGAATGTAVDSKKELTDEEKEILAILDGQGKEITAYIKETENMENELAELERQLAELENGQTVQGPQSSEPEKSELDKIKEEIAKLVYPNIKPEDVTDEFVNNFDANGVTTNMDDADKERFNELRDKYNQAKLKEFNVDNKETEEILVDGIYRTEYPREDKDFIRQELLRTGKYKEEEIDQIIDECKIVAVNGAEDQSYDNPISKVNIVRTVKAKEIEPEKSELDKIKEEIANLVYPKIKPEDVTDEFVNNFDVNGTTTNMDDADKERFNELRDKYNKLREQEKGRGTGTGTSVDKEALINRINELKGKIAERKQKAELYKDTLKDIKELDKLLNKKGKRNKEVVEKVNTIKNKIDQLDPEKGLQDELNKAMNHVLTKKRGLRVIARRALNWMKEHKLATLAIGLAITAGVLLAIPTTHMMINSALWNLGKGLGWKASTLAKLHDKNLLLARVAKHGTHMFVDGSGLYTLGGVPGAHALYTSGWANFVGVLAGLGGASAVGLTAVGTKKAISSIIRKIQNKNGKKLDEIKNRKRRRPKKGEGVEMYNEYGLRTIIIKATTDQHIKDEEFFYNIMKKSNPELTKEQFCEMIRQNGGKPVMLSEDPYEKVNPEECGDREYTEEEALSLVNEAVALQHSNDEKFFYNMMKGINSDLTQEQFNEMIRQNGGSVANAPQKEQPQQQPVDKTPEKKPVTGEGAPKDPRDERIAKLEEQVRQLTEQYKGLAAENSKLSQQLNNAANFMLAQGYTMDQVQDALNNNVVANGLGRK